jgi:hypothetical protein
VYIEEYVDDHNTDKARNRIPYDGYSQTPVGNDDCPF